MGNQLVSSIQISIHTSEAEENEVRDGGGRRQTNNYSMVGKEENEGKRVC